MHLVLFCDERTQKSVKNYRDNCYDFFKKVGEREKTRPDTRLLKSRAGGQGPYLRSLDHLGSSSGVKKIKS